MEHVRSAIFTNSVGPAMEGWPTHCWVDDMVGGESFSPSMRDRGCEVATMGE